MPARQIHLDVTELLQNPVYTGIQRIERELIANWPGPAALVPLYFDARTDQFFELEQATFRRVLVENPLLNHAATSELPGPGHRVDARRLTILNPELFVCRNRAQAYIDLARSGDGQIFWLVMDFLPHLNPNYFSRGAANSCMHYLRALREIPHLGFISEQTRDEFTRRIARRPDDGPVFMLGGDGLGLERQSFAPEKTAFLVVGTIEPRKRLADVLEAFESLWKGGNPAELHIVGLLQDSAERKKELLARLSTQAEMHYHGHASGTLLRDILRKTRATIFVSDAEGFGLPPYESLHAGIPVICGSSGVPSLGSIPSNGQIRLAATSPASIATAVASLMDDAVAERLWQEARALPIPSWKRFAHQLSCWVQGESIGARAV